MTVTVHVPNNPLVNEQAAESATKKRQGRNMENMV